VVDAEDVVQRTFERMVEEGLDHGQYVKPWLYTIADQLCRERQAAKRRDARALASPEMEVLAEAYQR
jgi:DNA-directed RNA polymerase specialized sigma24 family protein